MNLHLKHLSDTNTNTLPFSLTLNHFKWCGLICPRATTRSKIKWFFRRGRDRSTTSGGSQSPGKGAGNCCKNSGFLCIFVYKLMAAMTERR